MGGKNLLVFLHGKGGDRNSHKELVGKIAAKANAEVLALNAPFKHKGGYKWFDKQELAGVRQLKVAEFNQSVDYVIGEVEKRLEDHRNDWNQVILCGHSQGALLAIHLGLTMSPLAVISLCGAFPEYLEYASAVSKKVPIVWIEAGQEDHMSEKSINSYKILQNMGCCLHYAVSPHSTHDRLDEEISNLIDLPSCLG